jgi:hypothetical protein
LGRHWHSLALIGLTPGAGASRFGAAPAMLISLFACSLPIYLAVYYLCHLQMPSSSSCPSPATNMYVCPFSFPPALRNLKSRRGKKWGSLICCLWYLPRGGRSGYPKISGRVIRVFKISGFENRYPKLQRVLQYPKILVPAISGSDSGFPKLPELLCRFHKSTYTILN